MISSKMIKVYVTRDEKEFINYADAVDHTIKLDLLKWGAKYLALSFHSIEEVVNTMMERKQELLKALQNGDAPC
jgi:hypothetical protein